MIAEELIYQIHSALRLTPTAEQERAIQTTALFLSDRRDEVVMLLRGSAGTGKTTLAAAIVRALLSLKQKLVLMAPTGRAAKVFSLYSGQPAHTIHRTIYRQRSAGDLSSFSLNVNLHQDTLFIVDEASMIANASSSDIFGSGCLLDDLVQYVYGGRNCRMLLIGDTAQLPPVGEDGSPALMAGVMRAYGLHTYECQLNEVLRQSQESGILFNATLVRNILLQELEPVAVRLQLKGFADITIVPGDELIESLASSYSSVGLDETIVVTRSNKRANLYNQGIRNTILDRDDELCRGDQLMVVKNNYNTPFGPPEGGKALAHTGAAGFPPPSEGLGEAVIPPSGGDRGVFNGDRCVVQRVRNTRELYGFRFADVTLIFPDYDDCEMTCVTLLDTLTTEAPALTREQQERLFNAVMDDYADVPYKADRLKKLKSDPYYNALQIKFGYAVTCHKAQGGQWAHVYIDQGYMTEDMLTSDYVHWLYTALTRATEHVFLVNWPQSQS